MSDPTPVLRSIGLRKNYPSGDTTLEVLRGLDFSALSCQLRGRSRAETARHPMPMRHITVSGNQKSDGPCND